LMGGMFGGKSKESAVEPETPAKAPPREQQPVTGQPPTGGKIDMHQARSLATHFHPGGKTVEQVEKILKDNDLPPVKREHLELLSKVADKKDHGFIDKDAFNKAWAKIEADQGGDSSPKPFRHEDHTNAAEAIKALKK